MHKRGENTNKITFVFIFLLSIIVATPAIFSDSFIDIFSKDISRYEKNAIPKIVDMGGSGIFDTGMIEKEVKFIGRVSFVPNNMTLDDNSVINLIVCEDWRGRTNAIYAPDDFCGAKISYTAYAHPIIVQIPVNKLDMDMKN